MCIAIQIQPANEWCDTLDDLRAFLTPVIQSLASEAVYEGDLCLCCVDIERTAEKAGAMWDEIEEGFAIRLPPQMGPLQA